MDVNEILSALPEEAPEAVYQFAARNVDRLGGDYLVYQRESWHPEDNEYTGWPGFEPEYEHHWCACCTCTACGESFNTGWLKGGGIIMVQGPDGTLMTTEHWLRESGDEYDDIVEIQCTDNDSLDCPSCGKDITLRHSRKLRNKNTYQLMVGQANAIGRYTAIVYWLVSRTIEEDGNADINAYPVYAAVLDENGKLKLFSHAKNGMYGRILPGEGWSLRCTERDPFQRRYYDCDSINSTKVGGIMLKGISNLEGQTGEKTGLSEYVAAGGQWPYLYLRFWNKHRNIENLAKAGWTRCIDELITAEVDAKLENYGVHTTFPHDLADLADWSQSKPHRMLGMSREAVRRFNGWGWDALALYRDMQEFMGLPAGDAETFDAYQMCYSRNALADLRDWLKRAEADLDFSHIDRYLKRQGEANSNGLRILLDYQDMLSRMVEGPFTDIEMWPPHLRAAHDRLAAMQKASTNSRLDEGFAGIIQKWGALEWSDGHICAVLPRQNNDLIKEGKALRHCVGSYGLSHVNGKIIVFIRHARRPERSWFTLNINLTGKEPVEIQLHGYGNEHAHGKKLRIPKEVRQFCDRWEKEILLPVFQDVKASEKKLKRIQIREAVTA